MRSGLRLSLGFAVGVTVLAATAAWAQQAGEPVADGRYTLQAVPDGIVRLDTRTGAMSLCKREEAGWACHEMPDDRGASPRAGPQQSRVPSDEEIDRAVDAMDHIMRHAIPLLRRWADEADKGRI